jgi:hypothetical protein
LSYLRPPKPYYFIDKSLQSSTIIGISIVIGSLNKLGGVFFILKIVYLFFCIFFSTIINILTSSFNLNNFLFIILILPSLFPGGFYKVNSLFCNLFFSDSKLIRRKTQVIINKRLLNINIFRSLL